MLRNCRVRPAWGAVWGLVVIGLLVAVVMGVRVFMASSSSAPTPVGSSNRSGDSRQQPTPGPSGQPRSNAADPTPSQGRSSAATVVVHIVGQVKRPGVIRTTSGSRVEEVIAASGGLTAQADTRQVNLARVVTDGEQLVVPAQGEAVPPAPAGNAPGGKLSSQPAGKVNVNSADAAALDALPGVGPVTARRIVEWRQAHGRFTSMKELQEVPGIGPKLLDQITPLVTL
ncbi:helix-hairpin-helix domain-containing protein [Austwickia chelonae]|uniref:helix-hairpin-helix domain-containing protein n=1 Tax=Austwickia chelonae TaxID=100225 RepID=UPI00094586F3|nr:helix-hairpin-helix domain-containing protein [Austwickia chelonae]